MENLSISTIIPTATSSFGPSQLRKSEINMDLTLSDGCLRAFTHFFFTYVWSPVSVRVKIIKSPDSDVILHFSY